MTICLQELESVFAQSSHVGVPDPVLPVPAARCSTKIAGASFADQVGSSKDDEGIDGDGTSPPHPTKNPPIKSVPHNPSKTCLPASKDAAGGRHALDGDY